ncbi:MAG: CDC27 family protein [Epsilonproteobacteria bacterium]|nr:CDC27 family protein [Campylobacterota bacterium]
MQVVIHGATDTKQDTKVVLKPSLNFMRKMQASFDSYYSDEPDNTPYPQHTPTTTKPQTPQIAVKQKNDLQEDKNTKKIVIETKNSMEDIKDAERRFEKNNSPALSLFLARQYYARKQYHKAYNYALITNQLDKEIEDSWLIFSKSLVKLGKKNKAIQALSEYIKYSHSSNAALLLDAIKTGKFQ